MTTHLCSRYGLDRPLFFGVNNEYDHVLRCRPVVRRGLFDRVVGIAPSPLPPGEQEAEYATLIARFVAVAQPRDAIEDLLTRDVIDLT